MVTCLDSMLSPKLADASRLNNTLVDDTTADMSTIRIESNSERKKRTLESKQFIDFITKKCGMLEKALTQPDICFDYGQDLEEHE